MIFYFNNTWKCGIFEFHLFPFITYYRLLWKDKYGTPRVERFPELIISWLGFKFGYYYSEHIILEKLEKKYYYNVFKKELLTEKIKC